MIRSRRFELKLTPEEDGMLRELATLDGMSASDQVRMLVRRSHAERVTVDKPRARRANAR
jgi:hypothetical protein